MENRSVSTELKEEREKKRTTRKTPGGEAGAIRTLETLVRRLNFRLLEDFK